jgi:hypothetical protein
MREYSPVWQREMGGGIVPPGKSPAFCLHFYITDPDIEIHFTSEQCDKLKAIYIKNIYQG